MILDAISLWQPWGSLPFAEGHPKQNETRHWPLPARLIGKRVAIHAARKRVSLDSLDPRLIGLCADQWGPKWNDTLPRGAVIGTAILAGCRPTDEGANTPLDALCGNWEPGRFAWALEEPQLLVRPYPVTGRQGFFTVDLPPAFFAKAVAA